MQPPRLDSQIRREEGDESLAINFKDSDIREVLEALSEQGDLNILASKSVTGKVSASLKRVDVQTALAAILKSTGFVSRHEGDFIYVGTPEDFKSIDQAQDTIGTRIYRTNYVTATELSTLIAPLLTEGIGQATVSSPADVDIPSDGIKTGGDKFAGGEVLLVRDYESVLQQVDQIVEEVDQQPLQVAIEAVIMTVNLDDGYEMGVNFELLRDNDNIRIISGVPLSDLANIDPDADGGLKIGFLDTSLSVLLKALETVGDTNVVASPKVMCLNKQRAEVHIGEELAYVTTTVTETTATQTVEFLEVGTQLRIRPFISSDGMIRMELHPELSTGNVRVEGNLTLPDKEVTQVTSNVMCRDGCTVVIGGLIREDLSSTTTQIPLFGSLPFVGPAFRQKVEELKRDEIIVLITPQIVHDPFVYAEGNEAMSYVNDRREIFADKMSPIGTRFYGRQYARKAAAARAAGDVETALRYVNLAIHFDRQNPDAIRLRREIVAVRPQADNNIRTRLRQGLRPLHHPHVEYSREGWPWRIAEPLPAHGQIIEMEQVPVPQAEPIRAASNADNSGRERPEERPSPTPRKVPVKKPLPRPDEAPARRL
jgi:type IV pilus assembly protein PilQ